MRASDPTVVRYLDPEDHPELERKRRDGALSPAEKLERQRARNAALEGPRALEAAREVALRLLDSRSRSTGELRRAITQKGFSEEIADEVLDRLARVGLVDDEAFARALVADRFRGSGKAGRALVEEMRRKGLDDASIDEALGGIDEEELRARARELVDRRLRTMGDAPRDTAYRRLAGMLARKGYAPSLAAGVIAEALARRESIRLGTEVPEVGL